MSVHTVRLSDLGEGIVEAEIVEWLVDVGDAVTTETALAVVLTDKAAVEVSCPVSGTVSWLGGDPGDILSVGANLAGIETGTELPGEASAQAAVEPASHVADDTAEQAIREATSGTAAVQPVQASDADRPLAQPSVRKRARELDIDLHAVKGTASSGRITHRDLDRHLSSQRSPSQPVVDTSVSSHPVRGVRRAIAVKMSTAWDHIPHITYVDEVDVTELESLRTALNERHACAETRLTILPFIIRALSLACAAHPHLNARFDDTEGVVIHSAGVHVGIATQTPTGLVVPVIRHVEVQGLWQLASEISSMADRARRGELSRHELSGSTITVSSLGALGGLVTTPIINYPEVAVVGVNKIQVRPVWRDGAFVPRKMMNLSSSFDHRVVDGWDAAVFVQMIKSLLETPATIFMDDP